MGNHEVGRGMAVAAEAYWLGCGESVPSKDEALKILDIMAKPYIGADAEFDDEMSTVTPLSRLVAIAFEATPEEFASLCGWGDESDEDCGMRWYDGPQSRFSARYKFC